MSIYDSKIFEPIISKIDDAIPGFYALFDRRLTLRCRLANLITGDVLRYILCDIEKLTQDIERYYDAAKRTPLEILTRVNAKHLQRYSDYFFKEKHS